jgi:abortive infection bacteriophage resistance protein
MDKPFLSYPEQVALLTKRKLTIDAEGERLLAEVNYYVLINGYSKPFLCADKVDECYEAGTTLQHIYALYQFDSQLRRSYLNHLLVVEQYFKGVVAYEFARAYPESNDFYLKPASYYLGKKLKGQKRKNLSSVRKKFEEILYAKPNQKDERPKQIIHYQQNYGYVPLWVLIEQITFSPLSKLYGVLPQAVKQQIVRRLSVDNSKPTEALSEILTAFSVLRNFCAHNRRIYNAHFGDAKKSLLCILEDSYRISGQSPMLFASTNQLKVEYLQALHRLKDVLSTAQWQKITRGATFLTLEPTDGFLFL